MPNFFEFINSQSQMVKIVFLLSYSILLYYLFETLRRTMQNKEERIFQEKICKILEIETLPVHKPGKNEKSSKKPKVNWKKVSTMIQAMKNFEEKNDILDELWDRKNADYKQMKKQKHKYLLQLKNK